MNILMMTLLYPNDQLDEAELNAKDKIQYQINNYQRAFEQGICSSLEQDEKMTMLNCLPVGTFPFRYRQLFLKKGVHDNGTILQLSALNLPLVKQWMRKIGAKKELLKWIKASADNRHVLVYTQYLPYLKAIIQVKKRYPDLKATVIVTDLPGKLGLASGRKGIFKHIEDYIGMKGIHLLRKMDSYVFLTKPMANAVLQDKRKPYVIVEGTIVDIPLPKQTIAKNNVALYTGTLEKELGIPELLETFAKTTKYELWLCGQGGASDLVAEYAANNPNIKFFGRVPQQKALELQQSATLLINPRMPDQSYTKYSFPSKTLEYLRSGKPVVCCKLEGIPKEYDDYLQYFDPHDSEGIRKTVEKIFNLSTEQQQQIGECGRRFVLDQKAPKKQCKKILDLMRTN